MSLFAISGGTMWEVPRVAPALKQDPERPMGALRAVAGRETDAARAAQMLADLWQLTHDEQAQKDAVRALIRAGIVEVARG